MTVIEEAEQAQTTIAELEQRAIGLRLVLEAPADLAGDFSKAALARLQAREELTAIDQELKRQRAEYNAQRPAVEAERQRMHAQANRRDMARALVADLRATGLAHHRFRSLEIGDFLRKVDQARAILLDAGEPVGPLDLTV